jgi:hypothetical protein
MSSPQPITVILAYEGQTHSATFDLEPDQQSQNEAFRAIGQRILIKYNALPLDLRVEIEEKDITLIDALIALGRLIKGSAL